MTVTVGFCAGAHVHTDLLVELFEAHPRAEVGGITPGARDRADVIAERHDITRCTPATLFERVDAVCVCSTTANHGHWIRRAADAGVAVLCEKPLATDLDCARESQQACADAGVPLGMVMPLPFSDPARRAREYLAAGQLGELELLVGTNRAKLRNRHETGWSADPDAAGGGAVMDHTVHIVGLVRWLTDQEVVSVHAELASTHDALTVEDVSVLSMALEDGTPFSLDGSWNRPDNWEYWGDATLTILGATGELSIDCYGEALRETRTAGQEPGTETIYAGTEPMAGVVDDFIEAVRTDRSPLIDGHDGVRELAVCRAAYDAAATGEPVTVEYE